MRLTFLLAVMTVLVLPKVTQAAEISGPAKVREGDAVVIGTSRIRLGGIDAPSVDQLCLNDKGERWTCGVAARDELILRHKIFRLCNRAAILLTVLVLLSLPVLFLYVPGRGSGS